MAAARQKEMNVSTPKEATTSRTRFDGAETVFSKAIRSWLPASLSVRRDIGRLLSGECKAAGGERQRGLGRLVSSRGVFFLGEEFADVFDRAYQNHYSRAGDPEKEHDLEQTQAKNN